MHNLRKSHFYDDAYFFRLLMNNVNSISQMNSMVCEHSSLIGPDVKKGPIIGEQGPDGKTILNITLIFHKPLVVSYFDR